MKVVNRTIALAFLSGFATHAVGTVTPPENLAEQQVAAKLHYINQQEVTLVEEVIQRTENKEVKEFAQMLKQEHETADAKLKAVVEKLGLSLVEYVPQTEEEKAAFEACKAQVAKLKTLQGKEFDIEFLQIMITEHEQGISWLQTVAATVQAEECQSFLTELVTVFTKHATEAKKLLAQIQQ